MIYEDENNTREKLLEIRKSNVCAVCEGSLDVFLDADIGKAFLACRTDRSHQGIERIYEPTPFEKEGYGAFNIPTRREMMEQEYGAVKTKALDKYMGVVSITKPQAREILETVYPEAPEVEIARAVLLCASYALNPLKKHVYLIKFNKWNEAHSEIIGEEWVTVLGIGAKRLMASRRSPYSYINGTPRVMTEEEQIKTFGEAEPSKLWVITKLKDPATGAESVGYGCIGRKERFKGEEKGNTRFNMAAIRSESPALDRLRPGEMPQGIEVIDEQYAPYIEGGEGRALLIKPEGDEKIGVAAEEEQRGAGKPGATIFSSPKREPKNSARVHAAEPEGFHIDMTWLREALKELNWSDDTAKTYLIQYKVSPVGTLEDVIKRLTKEQAEEFVKHIQNKLQDKQMELFP